MTHIDSRLLMDAEQMLTPCQGRVLRLLLTKASVVEIAAAIGKTEIVAQSVVDGIYRRLKVSGRTAVLDGLAEVETAAGFLTVTDDLTAGASVALHLQPSLDQRGGRV